LLTAAGVRAVDRHGRFPPVQREMPIDPDSSGRQETQQIRTFESLLRNCGGSFSDLLLSDCLATPLDEAGGMASIKGDE
jgi:hypothetical protein